MNFTNSPYEKMMKEIPHPGHGGSDPCEGCRHIKECRGQNGRCRKKFRTLLVERGTSGQLGPKS
ncbi:hypothetical protein [Robinsoniella peoriensis]|uniref:hypothetical protein n=1 Tax=Robinsoniella peoriensis TaxID=180332 RepID=UPI00085C99B9|nr:hypothetical protein [Robinsoniella peoriensis]